MPKTVKYSLKYTSIDFDLLAKDWPCHCLEYHKFIYSSQSLTLQLKIWKLIRMVKQKLQDKVLFETNKNQVVVLQFPWSTQNVISNLVDKLNSNLGFENRAQSTSYFPFSCSSLFKTSDPITSYNIISNFTLRRDSRHENCTVLCPARCYPLVSIDFQNLTLESTSGVRLQKIANTFWSKWCN